MSCVTLQALLRTGKYMWLGFIYVFYSTEYSLLSGVMEGKGGGFTGNPKRVGIEPRTQNKTVIYLLYM